MIVLITGSRYWKNIESIANELEKLPEDTIIVHGNAKGADTIAGVVAKELGFSVKEYPADWSTHGKAAGAIRNRQMFDQEKIDKIIAFHEDINSSKGTKDMINYARAKGFENIDLITK